MQAALNNLRVERLTPELMDSLAPEIPGAGALLTAANILCAGVAYAFFADDACFGLGGVFPFTPGVGELWMMMHPDRFRHPKFLRRAALRILGEAREVMDLHRIQSAAEVAQPYHSRWMVSLGFEFEGIMRAYTFDRRDMARYALIFTGAS